MLSKAQILDHVWNYDFGGEGNIVESYVSYLRRKVDTTEPRLIATVRGGNCAVLDVADDGPGMTEEDAARAFERFYRADPSRARRHGGSGLGLAIVAALVAAHDGSVHLDTAPGSGTTVRVRLPLRDGHRETPRDHAPRSQAPFSPAAHADGEALPDVSAES